MESPCRRAGGLPRRLNTNSSSEVIFESQLDVARPDFRAGDLAEAARAVARVRIAEDRVVERVGRLHPELDPLILPCLPALEKREVHGVQARPAVVEVARRRAESIRAGPRERSLVEVAVQPAGHRARRGRVADEVRALAAVPECSARLRHLKRRPRLQGPEPGDLPAADDAVHPPVRGGAEGPAVAEGKLESPGYDEAVRHVVD